jgi:hypothetical protein
MKQYHFSVDHAIEFGVDEAVLINNFQFWIEKNMANSTNFHDGRTWTYNSAKAFKELFTFWSERQIRRILNSLKEKGVIMTGNYNSNTYDRTIWYAFVEEAKYINVNMHITKRSNGNTINGKMELPKSQNHYTDNNTDNNTDNIGLFPEENQKRKKADKQIVFDYFWEAHIKKTGTKPFFSNIGATMTHINKMVKHYGVSQLTQMIDRYFDDSYAEQKGFLFNLFMCTAQKYALNAGKGKCDGGGFTDYIEEMKKKAAANG